MQPLDLFIVHWNQAEACLKTIEAFRAQQLPLHIVVIDNHSKPDAWKQLHSAKTKPDELFRLPQNHGWGGALNALLRSWTNQSSSPYCLISAHDAIPHPRCLKRLLAAAEADPQIGIAAPQYPEHLNLRYSRWRGIVPENLEPQLPGSIQISTAPHGTLMLLRRSCLQEIGLFDERYFAYGDEHELGLRASRRGWKVALVSDAVVTNPATNTASALRTYLFARNSLLMVRQYSGRLAVFVRALLILANSIRPGRSATAAREGSSGKLQWRAVRDYLAGRFGEPDPDSLG